MDREQILDLEDSHWTRSLQPDCLEEYYGKGDYPKTGSSKRGMEMLLNSLVGLQLHSKG